MYIYTYFIYITSPSRPLPQNRGSIPCWPPLYGPGYIDTRIQYNTKWWRVPPLQMHFEVGRWTKSFPFFSQVLTGESEGSRRRKQRLSLALPSPSVVQQIGSPRQIQILDSERQTGRDEGDGWGADFLNGIITVLARSSSSSSLASSFCLNFHSTVWATS